MGRKAKEKDIAGYLWHMEPVQINKTNDNWRVRYCYLDSNGKEHQTTETLTSKKATDSFVSFLKLRETEHKRKSSSNLSPLLAGKKLETVSDLLYDYAEHAVYLHTIGDKYGWDESTYKSNLSKIRNYIVPIFGNFRIWEITKADLNIGFKQMLQLPRSTENHKNAKGFVTERTRYDCKKILSRAFFYVTNELELIDNNPMLGVNVPNPKSKRRKVWTQEQFYLAYDNCNDEVLNMLMTLMVALSVRTCECLAITWSDIFDNYDSGEPSYIRVYKELVFRDIDFMEKTQYKGILKVFDQVKGSRPNAKRRAVFHLTKTEKDIDERTDRIYIGTEIIIMLRKYKEFQDSIKAEYSDLYRDDDLVFAHSNGDYFDICYVEDMFRNLYTALELPAVDLYSLRHFSITTKLEKNGHDYVSLSKDSGHKRLGTIQEYYETPEEKKRIETANQMGKFLIREDVESSETIADEFLSRIEKAMNDDNGRKMLELALSMFETNNDNHGKMRKS